MRYRSGNTNGTALPGFRFPGFPIEKGISIRSGSKNIDRDQKILIGTKERLIRIKERLIGTKERLIGTKERLVGTKERLIGTKERLIGIKEKLIGIKEKLIGIKEKLIGISKMLIAISWREIDPNHDRHVIARLPGSAVLRLRATPQPRNPETAQP